MKTKDIKKKKKEKSFWSSLHGVLTGCAAALTIIMTLIALYKTGILKPTTQPTPLHSIKKPYGVMGKEMRLNEFKALINRGVTTYPDKPNIAIVIESRRIEGGVSPENTLYNLLRTEKVNIIVNLFKEESFKAKGYFREIYDGDSEILRQANALMNIDYLILGKLDYVFQRGGIDKDYVSCNITFSYKVIDKKSNIVNVDSINIIGPGFSQNAALKRGLELIAENYRERIIRSNYN
jgi:hypothetical protein